MPGSLAGEASEKSGEGPRRDRGREGERGQERCERKGRGNEPTLITSLLSLLQFLWPVGVLVRGRAALEGRLLCSVCESLCRKRTLPVSYHFLCTALQPSSTYCTCGEQRVHPSLSHHSRLHEAVIT